MDMMLDHGGTNVKGPILMIGKTYYHLGEGEGRGTGGTFGLV